MWGMVRRSKQLFLRRRTTPPHIKTPLNKGLCKIYNKWKNKKIW